MKISDLRKLVKIANRLDATGYERLADELDAIVREAADPDASRGNVMPVCPNHPGITLEPMKKGWYCEECDRSVLSYEQHPRPDAYDPNDPRNYDSSAAYVNYRPEPEYDPADYCPIHHERLYRDRSGFFVCGECEWERRQGQHEDAQTTPNRESGIPHEYNSETVRRVFKILESNKRLSESQDGQAILKLLEIQGTDWRASDLFDIYAINVSFGSNPRWSLDHNEEFKKAILNIANSF